MCAEACISIWVQERLRSAGDTHAKAFQRASQDACSLGVMQGLAAQHLSLKQSAAALYRSLQGCAAHA